MNKIPNILGMLFFGFVSLFVFGIAIAGIYFCILEFDILMKAITQAPLSTKIYWISISAACLLIYREALKFGKACWKEAKENYLKSKYGDLFLNEYGNKNNKI